MPYSYADGRRRSRARRARRAGERGGERLTVRVVAEFLVQRGADALHDAAWIWPSTSIGLTIVPQSSATA
jgi:hypothetical protein